MRRVSRRPRSRRSRVAVAAAAIVLIGIVAYLVLLRGDDPRAGSERLPEAPVAMGRRVPDAYRIDYRLETLVDGKRSVTRSTTLVRRPFEGRQDDTTTAFSRHSIRGSAFWVPPGPPEADRRPDAVLRDAVRDGYADKRERRRVAGRICRVYRVGASSSAPSLPPLREADTVTDVCVDEAGLILEEVSYEGDEVSRRRVATDVSVRPAEEDLDVTKPKGDPRQIGSVQRLEDDSRLPGGAFWVLDEPPDGFEFRGRYSIVPAGQPGFTDPTARGSVITFVSDVWTRGPDVLIVDQGATQGDPPFGEDPNARRIETDELGEGELLYSLFASEARFKLEGTRFVRVRGTLEPSDLVEIAQMLEGVPGGPLRLKD